jgi:hypothetical protein
MNWIPSDFIDVACEILEATSDEIVTSHLASFAALHFESLMVCPSFKQLQGNAEFLTEVLKKASDRSQTLQEEIERKGLQLENNAQAFKEADECHDELNRGGVCHWCDVEVGSKIEKVEDEPIFGYCLICSGCYNRRMRE